MWGPIIGAGISSIGSLIGGAISSGGAAAQNNSALQLAREQMQFSRAEAQTNRDFQERMSSTAYQRAMSDMRTAGLNPILAYQQGGSSTPSGAQGQSAGASFENAMEGLGEGVKSASQGATRAIELNNVMAQTANTRSQEELNRVHALERAQSTITSAAQAKKADAETANIIASADNPAAMRELMKAQGTSAYSSAGLSDEQRRQLKEAGPGWVGQNILSPGGKVIDFLQNTLKNPPAGRSPKNQPIPGGRSMLDTLKGYFR